MQTVPIVLDWWRVMAERLGVSLATVSELGRAGRRMLRTWLLTGRIDAWGDDPPATLSAPLIPEVTWRSAEISPLHVQLFEGSVELLVVSERLGVVLTPAEATELGRSLIAAAQEMEVVSG